MKSSTKNDPKPLRDIAYYEQRFRNRVFSKLIAFLTDQAQDLKLTRKDIAERIRKDPALVSRWLSTPSNLTLDTISDLLLAVDAEADPPEIVLFRDRRPANYIHPLMAKALDVTPPPLDKRISVESSAGVGARTVRPERSGFKIESRTSTAGGS